jgi:hypothetical protein
LHSYQGVYLKSSAFDDFVQLDFENLQMLSCTDILSLEFGISANMTLVWKKIDSEEDDLEVGC